MGYVVKFDFLRPSRHCAQFEKKIIPFHSLYIQNVHADHPTHRTTDPLFGVGGFDLYGHWAWINSELNLRVIAKRYYVSVLICTHDMSNDGWLSTDDIARNTYVAVLRESRKYYSNYFLLFDPIVSTTIQLDTAEMDASTLCTTNI